MLAGNVRSDLPDDIVLQFLKVMNNEQNYIIINGKKIKAQQLTIIGKKLYANR